MELIIQLVAGAIGGNAAGMALKKHSLGTLWNSVIGIIGGGLGGQVLGMLGLAVGGGGGLDIASIVGQILSGGVGGGILLVIVGVVKKMLNK